LKNKLTNLDFNTTNSKSQIIPIITGNIENTEKLSLNLLKNGIYIPAIKPPTVPKNQARIRISLTTGHTLQDIEKFLKIL
jgi:8-amino-7-oxononanoate synthase